MQRFVEPRGKITHNKLFPNKSAQHLYIPVSLLVRNSAIVILRSGNEDWRFAIDAQIETEPKVGVELWRWNTTTESSEIIDNILVPKSSVASIQLNSHFIIARERNRLCISITYIAPHTNLSNNEVNGQRMENI
ncbi:hypothetical protein B566_EDAN012652 [Ephemera danica]|nr:hypothetical protein B566_EDAN012652 [Ephemera danica]